ncbi:MAG: hypothetical protein CL840_14205 [Crocinitomicaceae bacterium]|nr:hypothetical protein [Crocinitomicaceae bacterium]
MAYFVTIPVLFVVTSLLLVQFWDRVLTFRDNLRVDKSEKTVKTKYQKNYGKGRVRYTSTLTKSKKKK